MKSKILLSRVLGVCLALSGLVSAAPALALKPEVEWFHEEGTFIAADCGTFQAIEDYVLDGSATTFLDKAGDPVRVQIHVNFNGVLTNSQTGLALRDTSNHMYVIDLRDGAFTGVGLEFAVTVPGQGIAILDAGKLVLDDQGEIIFQGGPRQFLEDGPDLICAALG